jgi:hypothetical protein
MSEPVYSNKFKYYDSNGLIICKQHIEQANLDLWKRAVSQDPIVDDPDAPLPTHDYIVVEINFPVDHPGVYDPDIWDNNTVGNTYDDVILRSLSLLFIFNIELNVDKTSGKETNPITGSSYINSWEDIYLPDNSLFYYSAYANNLGVSNLDKIHAVSNFDQQLYHRADGKNTYYILVNLQRIFTDNPTIIGDELKINIKGASLQIDQAGNPIPLDIRVKRFHTNYVFYDLDYTIGSQGINDGHPQLVHRIEEWFNPDGRPPREGIKTIPAAFIVGDRRENNDDLYVEDERTKILDQTVSVNLNAYVPGAQKMNNLLHQPIIQIRCSKVDRKTEIEIFE